MIWLKRIVLTVVVLIVLAVAVSFLMPGSVTVERRITIQATPEQTFALLNSFERFNQWSPWFALDPDATYQYEGPATGIGAKMSWVGNDAVGSGGQEIIGSTPHSLVQVRLRFGDMGEPLAQYHIKAVDGGTEVVWTFEQEFGLNPLFRLMGPMFDSTIGTDYERGLAQMKTLLEKASAAPAAAETPADAPAEAPVAAPAQ